MPTNFFDKVQAGSHILAAAVSLTLGIALVGSGSWLLHRVQGAQSLIYFISGYFVGRHQLPFQNNLNNIDIVLSDLMVVLKISCSCAIIGGLLQIISSAILIKLSTSQKLLIAWTVSSIISTLLSLSSLIIPLAYGLKNFLELHVLFTVSGLNSFILVHLFAVVIVQIWNIRATAKAENTPGGDGDDVEIQISSPISPSPKAPSSVSSTALSTARSSVSNNTPSGLPTPPPSPKITPKASSSAA